MCGIFAASRITEYTRPLLPILAWEMRKRGTDAWGASDGSDMIKRVGSVTDSWELPENWAGIIGHTRQATHGSPKEAENAHPFRFDRGERTIIGVHNGIIRSHTELNKKYSRDFQVDSMHAYAHLIDGLPLKEIEGYGALVWWEITSGRRPQMCLAKFNMHDLHACLLTTGEIVVCSQFTPIQDGAPMFGSEVKTKYLLEDNVKYTVREGEDGADVLFKGMSLPFGATGLGTGTATGFVPMKNRPNRNHSNPDFSHIYTREDTGRDGTDARGQVYGTHRSTFTPPWGAKQERFVGRTVESECFQCGRGLDNPANELFCSSCLTSALEGWYRHGSGTPSGNNGNSVSTHQD